MQHLESLMDQGWELKVSKRPAMFPDRPYVAQIEAKEIVMDVVSGHCYSGRTLSEALECLESYVAEQTK
jgi:hypothetical protein